MAVAARQHAVAPRAVPADTAPSRPQRTVPRSPRSPRSHGAQEAAERSLRPTRRQADPARRVVATRRHGGLDTGPQPLVRATAHLQASERHLSLVAPRGRRAAHVAVVMSLFLGLAMLGAAAFQTRLAQRQVELDQLDTDISSAREQYESLRRERAELRSPERLAQVAAANGMVPARGSEFLEIAVDVRSLVAASTGDIDPVHLGAAGNTLDDFRDVKATTAAAGSAAAP